MEKKSVFALIFFFFLEKVYINNLYRNLLHYWLPYTKKREVASICKLRLKNTLMIKINKT